MRVQPELIKQPQEEELPSSTDIKSAQPVAKQATSMSDRLAALTAEPAAATFSEGISLTPAGSDVLSEDERHVFEELDIDTSAIGIDLAPGRQ